MSRFYTAHALIFLRLVGERARSPDEMVELARLAAGLAASSPQALCSKARVYFFLLTR